MGTIATGGATKTVQTLMDNVRAMAEALEQFAHASDRYVAAYHQARKDAYARAAAGREVRAVEPITAALAPERVHLLLGGHLVACGFQGVLDAGPAGGTVGALCTRAA